MEQGNLSRRGFLQRSLAAMTAAGVPAWYANELLAFQQEDAAKAARKVSANDRVVMGAIGIGSQQSRGRAIMNDARRFKQVQYVAVCDVDERHLERAATKDVGGDCAKYKDFRELLDRKDIDAVTIATPEHWHTLVAIDAMKKGKDVYCEKPLTLTIDEGKALVKVARGTERVFQTGSQQRSDARFRLACELVRNGRIGKIKTIETRIGDNPQGQFKTAPVPKELDWEFWQGPVARKEYVPERCHYQFRWWYDYSGGKITDWGAHHNDIAQWALGMDGSGPIAVEATGTPPKFSGPHAYNCHSTFRITYTYENGTKLLCKNDGENGIHFEGEDGKWIFVARGKIRASDPKLLEEPLKGNTTRLEVSNNHMGNFMDCRVTRKRPICDVEVGHRSVSVCHIGAIALRTGKKLKWDPVAERFDDEEANKWLFRPYEKPWKLEV